LGENGQQLNRLVFSRDMSGHKPYFGQGLFNVIDRSHQVK